MSSAPSYLGSAAVFSFLLKHPPQDVTMLMILTLHSTQDTRHKIHYAEVADMRMDNGNQGNVKLKPHRYNSLTILNVLA